MWKPPVKHIHPSIHPSINNHECSTLKPAEPRGKCGTANLHPMVGLLIDYKSIIEFIDNRPYIQLPAAPRDGVPLGILTSFFTVYKLAVTFDLTVQEDPNIYQISASPSGFQSLKSRSQSTKGWTTASTRQGPKSLVTAATWILICFMIMPSPVRDEAPSWWPEGCHSAGLWHELREQSSSLPMEWGENVQHNPHKSYSRKIAFRKACNKLPK